MVAKYTAPGLTKWLLARIIASDAPASVAPAPQVAMSPQVVMSPQVAMPQATLAQAAPPKA
jgi:hypothetical protein